MCLTEFDEKKFLEIVRREGRLEGKAEGRLEGRAEGKAEGRLDVLKDLVRDGFISKEEAEKRIREMEEE